MNNTRNHSNYMNKNDICMYIYIYRERERYTHIYIYIEREREGCKHGACVRDSIIPIRSFH